jgi:hypothetical protein
MEDTTIFKIAVVLFAAACLAWYVVAEPAPAKRHCPYCHTLVAVGNGTAICGDEKCAKKHQRDKDIQRLDLAHQRCGGGLVQQGKNRQ